MAQPAPDPVPVDLRDYVAFDLERPVRSRIYQTEMVAFDVLCLEPGQQLGARTHPDSDTIYVVIGGRAWVVTDQAEVSLDPMHAVLVPAGTTYGVRNDSADPLLLQALTSPPVPAQSLRGTRSNEPLTEPSSNSSRRSPA